MRITTSILCVGLIAAVLVLAPGASAFTGTPIPFGMLGPFTGFEADLGAAIVQGSKAAQLAINEAGGILGRKLVLVPSDTAGDMQDAAGAIHFLIGPSHVVVIIGPETMEYYTVRPIFTQAQIPDLMQGGDVALDHETDPYFWRDSPSDSVLTVAMALYAHRQGYTRAAIMMVSERSAQTMKIPLARRLPSSAARSSRT